MLRGFTGRPSFQSTASDCERQGASRRCVPQWLSGRLTNRRLLALPLTFGEQPPARLACGDGGFGKPFVRRLHDPADQFRVVEAHRPADDRQIAGQWIQAGNRFGKRWNRDGIIHHSLLSPETHRPNRHNPIALVQNPNEKANGRRQPAGSARHQPADAGRSPVRLCLYRRAAASLRLHSGRAAVRRRFHATGADCSRPI